MSQMPKFNGRARWAVPSGAVAAVGVVVVAGSVLSSAQAAPALPPRTPAQLIAAIAANKSVPSSLSGTITWNAALGLPALPSAGGPASVPSLLAGSHTVNVWYARPGQFRLALPVTLGETDLRVDGRQVWLWDSKTNTATHIKLSTGPAMVMPGRPVPLPSRVPLRRGKASQRATTSASRHATVSLRKTARQRAAVSQQTVSTEIVQAAPTPQDVARSLLKAVGPTTVVSVQSNVMIAGRAAYQLVLAPKNPGSLIGRVSIAVDASRYLPLRVQVFARGAASPAFQVGFTALSFARPAAANFTFTPPPGAKVKTVTVPANPLGALAGVNGAGFAGLQAGPLAGVNGGRFVAVPRRMAVYGPGTAKGIIKVKGMPKAVQRRLSRSAMQHVLKVLRTRAAHARLVHPGVRWHGAGWYAYAPTTGGTFPPGVSGPRAIGSGWTAVGVFPAAGLTAGSAGSAGPEAGALLRAATPVHGAWGSGRLLRTSLFSVLITNNGKALIGAVTPAVLYAAAAQAK